MNLHQKTFKELSDSEKSDNKEYSEFLEKFEPKLTTDDCFTPDLVYDAVADFVCSEFNLDRSNFVRPFYPGGDFEHFEYKPDSIVVDNPPFSIITKIARFYSQRGIKFFLFAPTLTCLAIAKDCADISYLITSAAITYNNGAAVNTSFVTNLYDDPRVSTCPRLIELVDEANRINTVSNAKKLPKHIYPDSVLTIAKLLVFARVHLDFTVSTSELHRVSKLDSQKTAKAGIFGSGFLMSEAARAKMEAARAKMEAARAKMEAARAKMEAARAKTWELSDRELDIIKTLNERSKVNKNGQT